MQFRIVFAAALAAGLAAAAAAQPGPAPVAARQLAATLGNTPAMDAWQGRTIRLTGQLGPVSSEDFSIKEGMLSVATCKMPKLDKRLAAIARGQKVVVTGTVSRVFHGFSGYFELSPCALDGAGPAAPEPRPAAQAPANPPMGDYAVYQGAPFGYRYGIRLMPGGRYLRLGTSGGTYSYNPPTRVIRFAGGPLAGFVGLYYTHGRNNDEGKPAIAIDAEGHVPDLASASNGAYGYAYFRPEGLR